MSSSQELFAGICFSFCTFHSNKEMREASICGPDIFTSYLIITITLRGFFITLSIRTYMFDTQHFQTKMET